ncbi:MAG: 50S ribosomal protein L13 [Proteobacteria bacterium]|nr:50S ribosomal protein L13 [Pseudomonadota bacterium]
MTASRPNRATRSIAAPSVERSWYVADADDQVLGRLATRIATVLRGKHKPSFTPHVDGGDYVIVVNAGKVRLTGRKLDQKTYHRHTGYMGGIKSVSARRMLETHPERVLRAAVRGMLPKGPLGRQMLRKLRVYAEAEHPHAAQKPQPLEFDA